MNDGDEVGVYGIDPTLSNLGDAGPRNGLDNNVDMADLVVLKRLVSGAAAPAPTPLETTPGDINGNGQLDAADLLLLQQAVLTGTSPQGLAGFPGVGNP